MYGATRDAGFGAEVKRRILLGTFVLSAGYYDAYYLKAQRSARSIRRDFDAAFRDVDVHLLAGLAHARRSASARRSTTRSRCT